MNNLKISGLKAHARELNVANRKDMKGLKITLKTQLGEIKMTADNHSDSLVIEAFAQALILNDAFTVLNAIKAIK